MMSDSTYATDITKVVDTDVLCKLKTKIEKSNRQKYSPANKSKLACSDNTL